MKVVRLHARGDLQRHEEPEPVPGPGDLLLRVVSVGLCGSDRHWFEEGTIGGTPLVKPLVLGHEILAVIEGGSRAGERMALDPAIPCGVCGTCRRGDMHLCPKGRFAGYGETDGGLRELLAWPEKQCHPIPDGISNDEAVLLEPLGVALHAYDLGHVRRDMCVGVFGCGPIGQILVSILAAVGAGTVAVSDPLSHRLEAALAVGEPVVAVGNVAGQALEKLELDVAFEVAGTDAAIADALTSIRPGGRVVLVGIPDHDRSTFQASIARRKGVTLMLSRRMKANDLARAIEFVGSNRLGLGRLVTERYPLPSATEAFDALVSYRGIKTVVAP